MLFSKLSKMWYKDGEKLILEKEAIANHKLYLERKKLYQTYGFDIDKERKFVLDKTRPLYGDILEVGTGKGYFTFTLAKKGYKFTSVDISKEEQDIARLNLRYFELENSVDFRIENAENLSFGEKSFDIIFSINTIHHLKSPFKAIDEFIRVMSFKGKIIISDFTNEGFEILDKIHAADGRRHEKASITLKDVKEYFKNKGFEVNHYESKFQEILKAYKQVI